MGLFQSRKRDFRVVSFNDYFVSTFPTENSWEEGNWNPGYIPSLLACTYNGFGRYSNKQNKWSCWQDTHPSHCEIRGGSVALSDELYSALKSRESERVGLSLRFKVLK